MEAKEPEKKMPSTAANATSRSPVGRERGKISETDKKIQNHYLLLMYILVTKRRRAVVDPLERPVGLPLHTGHGVNGVE